MKEYRVINDFPDRLESQINEAAADGFTPITMTSEGEGTLAVLMEREVSEKT